MLCYEARVFRVIATLGVAAVSLAACTHDVVLPDAPNDDTCGDGIVESNEDCDNSGPGCTSCKATPGWQCVQNTCFYPCGDGLSGNGTGGDCVATTKDVACDMTGWWISRENDAVRDNVESSPQPASTWYLYRFSQNGGAFQVEQALHCGFHVTGNATVDCTPGTLKGLLYKNDPSVNGTHGPRKGTFASQANVCTFTFDRFYRIRGGTDALLPADFSQKPALAALTALPYETDPLHPTGQFLDNEEDTDGDGIPGAAFAVSGIISGIRESAQRDFKEYATGGNETVPANAIEFTVHGDWDLQESVLDINSCYAGDATCKLLITPGNVDNETLPPSVTMRYLGSTLDSPRVAAVVVQNPGEDVDADLETCANVRLALPHLVTLP
jgi:hypothetical protein